MAQASRETRVRRFGVFEVDFRAGELRKYGLRIGIQQKPLEILEALLAHPGEVVTREELRRSLWADATFVDFDHSINIAINKLRQALGDSGKNPRFVETLPRHGYRLLAQVWNPADSPRDSGKTMLAVLPFENLSDDPEQEYFCSGLTEEMIAQLGRLDPRRLGVVARRDNPHDKGARWRAGQIGKQLGVDHILEGSIRRSGDRVRITARLIQVRDRTHLWTETYDRKRQDVLDIQRNVARRIAKSLAMALLPAQQAAWSLDFSRNPTAHEAYLRGRYFWNRRTEESFAKAITLFEQAIAADPRYALAYAGLAAVYDTLALFTGLAPGVARSKAQEAAMRALEINPALAEAHVALGYAIALFDRQWVEAEREFQTAIELNTNCVTAHQWYGHLLAMTGRLDDALLQMDAAIRLDPLSLVTNAHKGWILYFARRFNEAAETLQRTLEMDPAFPLSSYFLGLVYLQSGRLDDAVDHLERARQLSQGHPGTVAALGQAFAAKGDRPQSLRMLTELEELSERRYVAPYLKACVYASLREPGRAIECREESWEHGGLLAYLKVDPALDSLRKTARFQRLLRRM